MQSDLFSWDWKDFVRGLVSAVIGGAFFVFYGVVHPAGCTFVCVDVFSLDWVSLFHLAVNGGFAGFTIYMGKRFISDEDGNTLGNEKL